MSNLKKWIKILVRLLSVLLFIYSLYRVFIFYFPNEKSVNYESSYENPIDPGIDISELNSILKKGNSHKETINERMLVGKVEDALKINKDVIGWIYIPNTNIDYPVLQAKDNNFYLKRTIDGKYNAGGSIFMDFRCDSSELDMNIIIYGHNMVRAGKDIMFTNLTKFKDKDFFNSNRYIYLTTKKGITIYEIFSAYVTGTDFYYIRTDFDSGIDYLNFINQLKGKSKYQINISLKEDDDILTLSTCTYEFNDARFVIHGKKIK